MYYLHSTIASVEDMRLQDNICYISNEENVLVNQKTESNVIGGRRGNSYPYDIYR